MSLQSSADEIIDLLRETARNLDCFAASLPCVDYIDLVEHARQRMDWDQAIRLCEIATQLCDASNAADCCLAVAQLLLGAIYHSLGDLELAEERYRMTAAELEDAKHGNARRIEAIAYYALGLAWQGRGDLEQARRMYQQCLRICSGQVLIERRARARIEHIRILSYQRARQEREFIPIIGRTAAGEPILAIEIVQGLFLNRLILNGRNYGIKRFLEAGITTPAEFGINCDHFALGVEGTSMIAAGIENGDYVIFRRQERVDNGDIAVVRIDNPDGARSTVKRFVRQGKVIQLKAENPEFKPQVMIFTEADPTIEILGKAVLVASDEGVSSFADVVPSTQRASQARDAPESVRLQQSRTVTRHTDITAPSRLALGRRGVITVALTCAPSPDSVLANALRLATGMLEVHLQVSPADFEVTGEAVKRLEVLPDRDSEPVVFYVTGRSSGVKALRLDFRQSGMVVGTAAVTIEVSASPVVEAPTQEVPGAVGFGGPSAEPPDLDLRVTVTPRDGGIALGYTLHSPNGAAPHHYQAFSEVLLPGYASAQAYQSRLRDTLETLQAGADVGGAKLTPAQIEDRLAAIGHELWESLFPAELRRALIGSWRRVKTLQITTDDPWIPWEMVRPYDASEPDRVVDEFLCERFQLTRWLAGDGGGAGEITVRRLACVEAGAVPNMAPLRHAPEERQQLLDLAARHGVAVCCPVPPALAAVEALLDDGDFGLWHFVGHGSVDPATPNEAPLALPDGRLRPTAIHGARQERIRRARPLMFLSACRVGGGGWALVGLSGWAAKLIGQARCGAFVAPQWVVDDALAGAFAHTFYEGIEAGQTIGEAAWSARKHVHELKPADPTWLAYAIYAQPNAVVTFGVRTLQQ